MSAITQVKVLSPEINIIALGQGFQLLEASIAAGVNGESVATCRGLRPWQVFERLTTELGRTLSLREQVSNKPERQGGDMAVG